MQLGRKEESTHCSHGNMLGRLAAILGLVAAALAAAAPPAGAGGFALKLAAPPKLVVGQPTVR